jgi:single-stranded DNA-binding protein
MLVQVEGLRPDDPPGQLKVVGWGNLAQDLQNRVQPGQRLVLEGRLRMNTVTRNDGVKEKRVEFTLARLHPLAAGAATPRASAHARVQNRVPPVLVVFVSAGKNNRLSNPAVPPPCNSHLGHAVQTSCSQLPPAPEHGPFRNTAYRTYNSHDPPRLGSIVAIRCPGRSACSFSETEETLNGGRLKSPDRLRAAHR